MRNYLLGLILLAWAGGLAANQDSEFIAARQAFQSGNGNRLDEYAPRLKRHVLWPYIEYYQLRMQLRTTDMASIRHFLSRYEGSLVGDRLRSDWLKILGKSQQWQIFDKEYPQLVNNDTELLCYAYQRRLDNGDQEIIRDARTIWNTPTSLPDSCIGIFQTLILSGQISREDLWARIRLALEEGQTGVATQVNRYLPDAEALNVTSLNSAAKNPLRYLDTHKGLIKSRSDREIALFALLRLLRNDTDQAYNQWLNIKNRLTASDRSYFLSRLGYRAAMRHDARALNWFKEAQNTTQTYPPNDTALGWQVRAALRAGNWDDVLNAINRMSVTEQQVDTWRYWKARALKTKGKVLDANTLFIPLSEEHSFYGQLAREELGTILTIAD
ncbi:MAG TPA: transglycosylase, partial [Nitrosomonas sp.]|nr:transglycosylase [Nitrosomonas sp.]